MFTGFRHQGRLLIVTVLSLALGTWMAMGCGSSGSSGGTTSSDSGGTSVDASSLKTVPSADVSSYDSTTASSSSSSSESVDLSKSVSVTKAEATKSPSNKFDTRYEGGSSRAGCEYSMHIREVKRFSAQAQLPRCYLQEMEAAGIISIPRDGTRKAFAMVEKAVPKDERASRCQGIPSERSEEKAACLKGEEGPGSGAVAARVGIINGGLEIDVCFGKSLDTLALNNESTFTGGSTPTFNVVEIGSHNGHIEKHSLAGTLENITSISEGEVTLGSGTAKVVAKMDGGFGSGSMTYEATSTTNTLTGGFKGGFKDPFSGAENSFTGKVYAQVGKSSSSSNISAGKAASGSTITGTAKFSCTGTNPPMKLRSMIPFDVMRDATQKTNFIKILITELNLVKTSTQTDDQFLDNTYLCPSTDFDPENPGITKKPMKQVSAGTACSSVTHTGVESFEVTTIKEDNAYKSKLGALADRFAKPTQSFKVIANTASSFYAAVNAFDLSKIDASAGSVAFARNWDCKGIDTTLDLSDESKITPELLAKLQKFSEGSVKCSALEERNRGEDGMGGHNCAGQENAAVMENLRNDPPAPGNADGEYVRSTTSCKLNGQTQVISPERLMINSTGTNKYCLPADQSCSEFTVAGATVSNLSLTLPKFGAGQPGSNTVTQIVYSSTKSGDGIAGFSKRATSAVLSMTLGDVSCQETYTIADPPSFTKPSAPPVAQFPDQCKTAGITDQGACNHFCQKPENRGCPP